MSERSARIGSERIKAMVRPVTTSGEGELVTGSGLQSQRTELAWLRTVLSSWAVAALTARMAFPAGIVAVTGPVAVTVIAHARRRRLREAPVPPTLSRTAAALLVLACVLIAVAAGSLI